MQALGIHEVVRFMEAATWGFIGTIVGAIASIATTAITNWSSYNLKNKSIKHEKEALANTFQREVILELQVELLEYIRTCSQIYKCDRDYFEKNNCWGRSIPDELDELNRCLSAKTFILTQRVSHDELRNNLMLLKSNCTKFLLAQDQYEANVYYASYSGDYDKVNKLLGQVLRSTYWQEND